MGNAECLSSQLSEVLSDELQREIDAEVLMDILKESGWYYIKLNRFNSREHAIDIIDWLDENQIRDTYNHGSRFMFKHQQDAIMFSLRWL